MTARELWPINNLTAPMFAPFFKSIVTSIVIPSSVIVMENHLFNLCENLNIFVEVDEDIPNGWVYDWTANITNKNVYYLGTWSYVNGVPKPNK